VNLAIERFGQIDVLYNNAAKAYFNWVEDVSDAEWRATLDEELSLGVLSDTRRLATPQEVAWRDSSIPLLRPPGPPLPTWEPWHTAQPRQASLHSPDTWRWKGARSVFAPIPSHPG